MPVWVVKCSGVSVWMSFIVGLSTMATVIVVAAAGAAESAEPATVSAGAATVSAGAAVSAAATVSAGASVSAGAAVSAAAVSVVVSESSEQAPAIKARPATAANSRFVRAAGVRGFMGPLCVVGADPQRSGRGGPSGVVMLFYPLFGGRVKPNDGQHRCFLAG